MKRMKDIFKELDLRRCTFTIPIKLSFTDYLRIGTRVSNWASTVGSTEQSEM